MRETSLSVNQTYAKKYEERKKKEELSQLQEKYRDTRRTARNGGDSDSSAESASTSDTDEDSDAELLTPGVETEIITTIQRIRNKDPVIYNTSTAFFGDQDAEADDSNEAFKAQNHGRSSESKRSEKPVFLKDILRTELLKHGGTRDVEADDDRQMLRKHIKSHAEEQEELRQEFLSAAGGSVSGRKKSQLLADDSDHSDADGDDLLKPRRKSHEEAEEEESEFAKFLAAKTRAGKLTMDAPVLQFFRDRAEDEDEEAESFLKDYLLNQKWLDRSKSRVPALDEVVGSDDADGDDRDKEEEFDEKVDEFEAAYNFRFEQQGADVVIGHPRPSQLTDSVRARPHAEKRKEVRERREERKNTEKLAAKEELKRLKALKKEELTRRINAVVHVAGAGSRRSARAQTLPEEQIAKLLEKDDFDSAEYDRIMQSTFGDEYYGDDDDDGGDVAAEDGEKEAPQKPVIGDLSLLNEQDREMLEDVYEDGDAAHSEGGDDGPPQGQRSGGAYIGRHARIPVKQVLAELDKMDYEDILASGLKTRFKYRAVDPRSFGLDTVDIFSMNERDLNNQVSLKRLAPYRTDTGNGDGGREMDEVAYRAKKRKIQARTDDARIAERVEDARRRLEANALRVGVSSEVYAAYVTPSTKTTQEVLTKEAIQKVAEDKIREKRRRKRERRKAKKASRQEEKANESDEEEEEKVEATS